MQITFVTGLALTLAWALATVLPPISATHRSLHRRTLDPAESNSKGMKPVDIDCPPARLSQDIQAAECSHNTRTHEKQTFAVFVIDHDKDKNHGAPYGNCTAYTCDVPTKFVPDENHWSFFWNEEGLEEGHGAGCIKNPRNGKCGCENSDGKFITGADNCK
ncbi:hypothetical protein SMMN14_05638 [Sphaerulina musiva]